jgi:hypothetical protein
MTTLFKIHPAIGIARLGNSPTEFCISPEAPGELPIACDSEGNTLTGPQNGELHLKHEFWDKEGRVKRQAARFRIFAYGDADSSGQELSIGQELDILKQKTGQIMTCKLVDITWTAYIANKKATWYQFQETNGEHGYSPDHPLRNAEMTNADLRQNLIIDPGPQSVAHLDPDKHRAAFAKDGNPGYAQSFPPALQPNNINTLGELLAVEQDGHGRLLLLGGYGNSGSVQRGLSQPHISSFSNNDSWFDDTSDGYVTATLQLQVCKVDGKPPAVPYHDQFIPVDESAWVIVGYPRYVPELQDMVTLDDALYDVMLRELAYNNVIYGVPPFDSTKKPPQTPAELKLWRKQACWNPDYYPYFWRDIWPILQRPENYQWVLDFDSFGGGDPHNKTPGGGLNFDPELLSRAPYHDQDPVERENLRQRRQLIYGVLRQPGEENQYRRAITRRLSNQPIIGMPDLCGDNPISNVVPSKFLRLTSTMLFMLKQWAEGKFINEQQEGISPPALSVGVALDRGVLSNLLGGAFCPGGEVSWLIRNPAIYAKPYRIRQRAVITPGALCLSAKELGTQEGAYDIALGMEPGDITKYDALPWQADFNECSTQNIDLTYEDWNAIYPASTGDPAAPVIQNIFWWPTHRPMMVYDTKWNQQSKQWDPTNQQVPWSGNIPQSHAGDFQMVTAWAELGFVVNISSDPANPQFAQIKSVK